MVSGELQFPHATSAKYVKVPYTIASPSSESEFEKWVFCGEDDVEERFLSPWALRRPEIMLWVTGQTVGRVELEPRLNNALQRGLKRVLRSTEVWVMTGGMNVGVVDYVGEAIGGFGGTPCIGIAAVQKVREWRRGWPRDVEDPLRITTPSEHHYQDQAKALKSAYAELEERHTHFVLVDNPEQHGWGGELDVASKLRHTISCRYGIPLVTLVIGGSVGNLQDVLDSLDSDGRGTVVVVRESGGCAQAVAEFINDYVRKPRKLANARADYDAGRFISNQLREFRLDHRLEDLLIVPLGSDVSEDAKEEKRVKATMLLNRIASHYRVDARLHIYSLQGDAHGSARADMDSHILYSVVASLEQDVCCNHAHTHPINPCPITPPYITIPPPESLMRATSTLTPSSCPAARPS